MPIVQCDVKNLEGHGAAFLSQDSVMMHELWNDVEMHSDNQTQFNLPERRDAKYLLFRILYGGTEYGFVKDPLFFHVGFSVKQWKEVIEKFYNKYSGLYNWHQSLLQEVSKTGQLIMPTGRVYKFKMYNDKWPQTQIKNYPVQGLGADVMTLYRILIWKELEDLPVLLISSVHDSIVIDAEEKYVDQVLTTYENCAKILYIEFEKRFGVEFNVPFRIESKVGYSLKE